MSHKEKQFFDIEEIKNLLATRIDDFVLTLFPNAKKEASCYRIGNLDGEEGRSMLISTRTNNPGYYMDNSTGDKGKAWNLVAAKHGLSVTESIAWLARFLGIQPIESFGSIKRSENPADLAKSIVTLTQRSIDYAKGRGISEETLRAYGVGSSRHQDGTCFPYYDAFGDLGRIKHWGHKPKPDGKKDTWVKGNVTALFGKDVCSIEKKIDRLVITEGECLSGDTEVLTTEGWMRLDLYSSLIDEPKIAQWNDDSSIDWVKPLATVVKDVNPEDWLSFQNPQMDLLVTPNHRMVYKNRKGDVEVRLAKNWPKNAFKIPKAGLMDGDGIPLSDDQIRLCIAVSADAAIDKRKNTGFRKACEPRYARMAFQKQRKIDRIRKLLKSCGIVASDSKDSIGIQSICFPIPYWIPGRILPFEWIEHASLAQRKMIIDELTYWDGNEVPNRNQTEYSSKYIENATWVQTLAATSGIASTIIPRSNQYGSWFKVSLLHSKSHCSYQSKPRQTTEGSIAYCVTVPSRMILVRRNNKICVTGNCDAMSCYELGIPAVSIPMGCSNMDWITNDYQYLSHFDEIVVMFDNDEVGKKAAKDVIARLGAERCMNVTLPLKDANEMLVKGRGDEVKQLIANAAKEPIAEIIDPGELKNDVMSYLRNDHINDGDPFFLPDFDITFRRHEVTLWFGYSFMGKSQAVQNMTANLAARGKSSCIASFEQPPGQTLAQVFTSFTADPNFVDNDEFELAYSHLTGLVYMYKSMDRADPKHLISTFIHAHRRYGVDSFVIDNVMTMNIDRGDNTAQASAMDLLRMFVAKYPVHLHIVAHPRKPPESTAKPPGMAEIRGASEWGDMPNNIITVWRDAAKAEKMAEMQASNHTDEDLYKFWQSTPCGKFLVRKQRTTGDTPMCDFWFHKETKRFMRQPGRPHPFYSEIPWTRKSDIESVDDDPF
jgi:hypothetical protein